MPPNIGLCIAGKAALRELRSTAALDARVVESQLEHLVPSLRHQGSLDVIFVLDSTDAADAEVQQILTRFQPLTVRYDNSSADAVDGRRRCTVPSYMKLAVCADALSVLSSGAASATTGPSAQGRPLLLWCTADS